MKYSFSEDRSKLIFTIYEIDRIILSDYDEIHSLRVLYDFFAILIANSELEWVFPEETGDLTSAPMFGIRDEDGKIIERWAYMDYQVESLLGRLLDQGEVILTSWLFYLVFKI